jgi:SAM-dependent methyltransferase
VRGGPSPDHDLDLTRWRELDDVITDSLWLLGARDRSSSHAADYWGNFVPQIPNQVVRRFTKAGGRVVDMFGGMGTTLIECRRLGRHGVAVELSPAVAARSRERIASAEALDGCHWAVLEGDAADPATPERVRAELAQTGGEAADCVLLHPPYHDIIRFGDDPRDLSNQPDEAAFLDGFGRVVANAVALLRPGGHLALVIGDVFRDGEVRPLGFACMERCRAAGLTLRAINVKDIQGNVRGKGQATNLWRYRALRQGIYVFRHEYVMIFRKPASKG